MTHTEQAGGSASPRPRVATRSRSADPLDGSDEYLTLIQASALCGLPATTLRASAHHCWLWTIKLGLEVVTTRRHLERYLRMTGEGSRAHPDPRRRRLATAQKDIP